MDTREKIQLVLDVIDGKIHPSALKQMLDEPEEVNIFKCAVDHIVGKVLQQSSGKRVEFRFKLTEKGEESFTDWQPEFSQLAAGFAMSQVRLAHPHAEVSIERRY